MPSPTPTLKGLKLLAGPYFMPADKQSLGSTIAGLKKAKRKFQITNGHEGKKGYFLWVQPVPSCAPVREGKVSLTPKKLPPGFWKSIDWTMGDESLAAKHHVKVRHVRDMRRAYGPKKFPNY
jgi:hypothetical protein